MTAFREADAASCVWCGKTLEAASLERVEAEDRVSALLQVGYRSLASVEIDGRWLHTGCAIALHLRLGEALGTAIEERRRRERTAARAQRRALRTLVLRKLVKRFWLPVLVAVGVSLAVWGIGVGLRALVRPRPCEPIHGIITAKQHPVGPGGGWALTVQEDCLIGTCPSHELRVDKSEWDLAELHMKWRCAR